MEKLISGDSLKPKEQNELLSARNWEQNDLFRITLLKLSSQDISNSTMRYFCKEITDRFLHILACEKDNSIVILENLTHEKQHIEKDHQRFMEFIREGNFRAASSNPFYGLTNISSYIKEANITLEYGNKEKNTAWHQKFNDHALSYFIDKGTEEIDAERICAEEIRILQKYDKENDTQLCRTLRCYLRNKENASKTAKELFIQRGTLLYRLSRIEKLAGIRFDNYEQILFLHLSFHILDRITKADTF
ncbi:MAG: helix-turn-helix domain-containing protein [Christensenellaceae bacterium]|nr:helix-turn-helix domain-containing protein [Christensenellaceae bacterium]